MTSGIAGSRDPIDVNWILTLSSFFFFLISAFLWFGFSYGQNLLT